MTDAPKLGFAPFARLRGVLVVFCGDNLKFGPATQRALAPGQIVALYDGERLLGGAVYD